MNASNAIKLPNVIVSNKIMRDRRKDEVTFIVHQPLSEIAWDVIVKNPAWEFHVKGDGSDLNTNNVDVRGLTVKKDGEVLGSIECEHRYGNNRGWVFEINSGIIKAGRERSGGYCTKDPKKALAAIKKTFISKTINERINTARDVASNVIHRQIRQKNSDASDSFRKLESSVKKFAFELRPTEYEDYAIQSGVGVVLSKYKEQSLEMKTVQDIKNKFEKAGAINLVIVDKGKYIVKTGDEVKLYDDNTLPNDMRGKLGMLKLVEPEQMIEGVGCRATAEVFVLTAEQVELA
jgi:hypothetical protein